MTEQWFWVQEPRPGSSHLPSLPVFPSASSSLYSPPSLSCINLHFCETRCYFIAQAGLKLEILLLQLFQGWDYR